MELNQSLHPLILLIYLVVDSGELPVLNYVVETQTRLVPLLQVLVPEEFDDCVNRIFARVMLLSLFKEEFKFGFSGVFIDLVFFNAFV